MISTGAPVVMGTIGTLCAQDGLDCRTANFVGIGSKTTATAEPGTNDQWERCYMHKSTTNPGDNTRLVEDHLNQSGDFHPQQTAENNFNHPEEVG